MTRVLSWLVGLVLLSTVVSAQPPTAQLVLHTLGPSEAIIKEKRRSEPVSMPALSLTFNVHTPFGFCPSKAESGLSGVKLPATAPVAGMVETLGKPPSSSSTTVQ